MAVPQSFVDFLWSVVVLPRVGNATHRPDAYVWGGSFSGDDVNVGTDCSGAVSAELEAILYGPQMNYTRQFFTGTFAGAQPGDHGPWGGVACTAPLICIPTPDAMPDAAMLVAVRQMADPSDAHMICQVQGINIEMGGLSNDYHTSKTSTTCADIHDPEFNQWFALPGPIGGSPSAPPQPGDQYLLPIIAEGERMGVTPIGIQMGICCVLDEAGNPPRMWANSKVPESLEFPHDAVGDNGMSCGLFQQQSTEGWGTVEQEMDPTQSSHMFFTHLLNLSAPGYDSGAKPPWQYVEDVQGSATADGSNYELVWPAAQSIYARLKASPESWLDMATPDQLSTLLEQVGDLHGAAFNTFTSPSPYRHLDDTLDQVEQHQLPINADLFLHPQFVEWAATRGDPVNLAILEEVATGSPSLYPHRADDIAMAKKSWAIIHGGNVPIPSPTPNPSPTPDPTPTPTPEPPGTIAINTTQLMRWAKDAVVVLGAIGTYATAAHDLLGQFFTGGTAVAIPAALALLTSGLSAHTVHTKNVAIKATQ